MHISLLFGLLSCFNVIHGHITATTVCKPCGSNEVYSKCDNHPCQNTCEQPNKIASCTYAPGCYPGCICKQGFLRNSKGICTPTCECYKCKDTEVFSECNANGCQNTCANPKLNQVCDPLPGCYPGCICKPGYLRNDAGDCVKECDCPKKCTGAHEVYSECGNNSCQKNCDTYHLTLACKPICTPGCICEDGYIRNKKGICVKPEDCEPKKCKLNEVFSKCGNHPCQNTCEEPNRIASCSYIAGCYPGCICKEGFLRNSKGICTPACNCFKCKETEVFSECGANECQNTCANPHFAEVCRPSGCFPGCICKPGYLRNDIGECVKEKDCQKKVCTGKNEQYTECVCPCCETCATLGQDIVCNFLVCNPGCDCKPGFFRNSQGVCVPPNECDCKQNEELDMCFNPCPPQTCSAIGKMFKCPESPCKPACKCKFNYRRNSDGICIPIENCPPLTCTGQNEEYNPCPPSCLDERCESLFDPLICTADVRECKPACVCIKGHLRNKKGVCVPAEKCHCPGENQVVDLCPPTCPPEETCESYLSGIVYVCAAEPLDRVCQAKCRCAPGYVRKTPNGKCIKRENCCSDPNAEVVDCPNPCPGGTCESPAFAPCLAACRIRGCQCKKGYVKDADGKCILLENCPIKCTGPNEEYKKCGTACPLTCENKDKKIICTKQCVRGCFCIKGYVRKNGVCVKPEECVTCKGPNEFFDCGSACDTTCATLGQPCKIINIKCTEMCYCKPGFARNSKNICIPVKQCPCPGKNQVVNPCAKPCPPEETCESYLSGIPVDCAPSSKKICLARYECAPGYIRRTPGGECIKPNECCSDPNAEVVRCPNPCPGGTCEQPEFSPCKRLCVFRGCQCKKGYVKNKSGKCILLKHCPPRCPENEEYKQCGTACPATCDNYGKPIMCTLQCVSGCFCKQGLVRDCNGKCIDPKHCPIKCTGQNEEFQECGTACPLTCENKDEPIVCTEQCVRGCFCRSGFVRKNGICVKPEECACGDNEQFSQKSPVVQKTCATLKSKCICNDYKPGCICKSGYVRESPDGKCIKISDCQC